MPTKKTRARTVTVENLYPDTIMFRTITEGGEEIELHLGSTEDDTPEAKAAGVPQPRANVDFRIVEALRKTQLFVTFEEQNHIKVSRAA